MNIIKMKIQSNYLRIIFFLILFTLHFSLFISPARAQVGTWRNYLAYSEVQDIQAAGNYLFVLASNDLYQYNKNDQSIYTYDKTNGMNDTNISLIRWCPQAKRLVVVYSNSNIDLVDTKGDVINISDLYSKAITSDKSVSSIRIDGVYAYLVCGFGIVKLNVQRAEIADTYRPNHPEYPSTLPPEDDHSDYNANIELVKTLKPDGPNNNHFYFLKFINNILYTCGGLYHPLNETNTPGTIQLFNGDWTAYQDKLDTVTNHRYVDVDCLDVDPLNRNHVFAGGKTGLYEFMNGKFVREYTTDNSILTSVFHPNENKDYLIINGLKYDSQGNLWIVQSLNKQHRVLVLTSTGEWIEKDYNATGYLGNGRDLYIDGYNNLWFVNDHGNTPALYRYNMATDKCKQFASFVNQDGTSIVIAGDGGVRCLAEDIDGNMWIGTSAGPLLLEKSQFDNENYIFTQVKVPRNDGTNYADYLLSSTDIASIAIDGGGRKWFGTNGDGVYLISEDNLTQIHHFTTENSPLLSNTVKGVEINNNTGEVFFATTNGLCSYVSDATKTNTEMTDDNVWAYPNPVTPDYTGPITITGLTYNADVKILSSNGAIVNEGTSNGGTYVWDGCDKKGRRVASGVYMVATATKSGEKGTVCKIAVIN